LHSPLFCPPSSLIRRSGWILGEVRVKLYYFPVLLTAFLHRYSRAQYSGSHNFPPLCLRLEIQIFLCWVRRPRCLPIRFPRFPTIPSTYVLSDSGTFSTILFVFLLYVSTISVPSPTDAPYHSVRLMSPQRGIVLKKYDDDLFPSTPLS